MKEKEHWVKVKVSEKMDKCIYDVVERWLWMRMDKRWFNGLFVRKFSHVVGYLELILFDWSIKIVEL